MKRFFILACIVISATCSFAQSPDEDAVRKVLNNQQAAWNSGNIADFMKGYWMSDSLIFIGKSVTYGWRKTMDNYKRSYPDTAAMGTLSFDFLEFSQLSPLYYFVIGKWHLKRSAGDTGGYFTLLFEKIRGQWFIVADHSS